MGYGILIGVFVLMPILYSFGWENTLYLIGQTPAYIYSDMNGYGHFVPALVLVDHLLAGDHARCWAWSRSRWPAAVPRTPFAPASASALQRAPRLAPLALLFAVIAVGSGSWYFYNAHVLNEYLDSNARRDIQAGLRTHSSSNTRTCLSPRSPQSMPTSTSIPSADRSTATSA